MSTSVLRSVLLGTVAAMLGACKATQPVTAAELSAPLPAGTPYAVLHLYRPGKLAGFAIGYDVRLNDSVVYRARNASQHSLHRPHPGPVLLSAKTEVREELSLTLEPGREYYVRCSLGMGALVGRPHFTQVPAAVGRREAERLGPEAATPAPVR